MYITVSVFTYDGKIEFYAISSHDRINPLLVSKIKGDATQVEFTLPLIRTVECYRRWYGTTSEILFQIQNDSDFGGYLSFMLELGNASSLSYRFFTDELAIKDHYFRAGKYLQSETTFIQYDKNNTTLQYVIENKQYIIQCISCPLYSMDEILQK